MTEALEMRVVKAGCFSCGASAPSAEGPSQPRHQSGRTHASTLTTSAPRSARCRVARGPDQPIDRSTTRTPASGRAVASPGGSSPSRPVGTGGPGRSRRGRLPRTRAACSPRRGARPAARAGVRRSRNGTPGASNRPRSGCAIVAKACRARQCGHASSSAMVGTGASGMRRRCAAWTHSSTRRSERRGPSSRSTSSACSRRAAVVAKRGSAAVSGRPASSHSACHCGSVSVVTPTQPSRHG